MELTSEATGAAAAADPLFSTTFLLHAELHSTNPVSLLRVILRPMRGTKQTAHAKHWSVACQCAPSSETR